MDNLEQEQSGADLSAEPTESAPAASPEQSDSGETKQLDTQPKEQPFHEHPRFKELVEQKNSFQQQLEHRDREYRQQIQDFQRRLEQREQESRPKPSNAFVEDLRKINPEYAKTMEELLPLKEQVAQFQAWQQQQQMDSLRNQVISKVNGFYEQNKVPAEFRDLYGTQIENMIRVNNPKDIAEIDKYCKMTHETFSKLLDGVKRAERASYVKDKKGDSTPATQSGGAPAPRQTSSKPMTKADLIAKLASEIRANKEQV